MRPMIHRLRLVLSVDRHQFISSIRAQFLLQLLTSIKFLNVPIASDWRVRWNWSPQAHQPTSWNLGILETWKSVSQTRQGLTRL